MLFGTTRLTEAGARVGVIVVETKRAPVPNMKRFVKI